MRPPVHVDFPPDVSGAFENHDDALLIGKLDDLGGIRGCHQARAAEGRPVPLGAGFGFVFGVVGVDGGSRRLAGHPGFRPRAAPPAAGGSFAPAEGLPWRRRSLAATVTAAPTTRRWLRRDGTAIL